MNHLYSSLGCLVCGLYVNTGIIQCIEFTMHPPRLYKVVSIYNSNATHQIEGRTISNDSIVRP